MITETSVALEFMNRSERDSITSSVCNFAKAEEISETMSDAYPVDTNEMTLNLQTVGSASKTSHDRLLDSY